MANIYEKLTSKHKNSIYAVIFPKPLSFINLHTQQYTTRSLPRSHESGSPETFLRDDLDDVLEDDLDLVRVRGAREVVQNGLLPRPLPVFADQVQVAPGDELAGLGSVPRPARVVGDVVGQGEEVELGVEQVGLVQEKDHAGPGEEGVVHDVLEQLQALGHPVGLTVLYQDLERKQDRKGNSIPAADVDEM